jgi:hypothetical protein
MAIHDVDVKQSSTAIDGQTSLFREMREIGGEDRRR